MKQTSHLPRFAIFAGVTALVLAALPGRAHAIDWFNHPSAASGQSHTYSFSPAEKERRFDVDFEKSTEESKAAHQSVLQNAVAARQAKTAQVIAAMESNLQKMVSAQKSGNQAAAQQASEALKVPVAATTATKTSVSSPVAPAAAPATGEVTLFNQPGGQSLPSGPVFGVQ